jgi:alcohol dehydrogenase (cytochrome c)
MTLSHLLISAVLLTSSLVADGLDAAKLLQPATDTWPSYNGDYSGRRYSSLSQINDSNVHTLGLAWVYRATTGAFNPFGNQVKSTPLEVNGVLYFTVPDHAWAVDARTGRELWHYKWESKGGIHIGSRGVGIYGNWLYFETPDCHLISLNIKDGKERWNTEICDLKQHYFGTVSPIIVRNHVIVGVSGDDLDVPGYLESRDPENGQLQWRWNTEPGKGEPGAESWPSEEAAAHGGGMTWMPGTYDPDLNLYYLGTGNPQPVMAGKGRGGDNLYTESIVALNPDTGKMKWYFQPSPHDTHDWDAVQTPVLFDGDFNGRQRKLLAQASRNGYFFLLDRTNGEHLLTKPFIATNWAKEIDQRGRPMRDLKKDPAPDGTLVSPASDGATNWPPPSYDPQSGLFYVSAERSFSVFYLTDTGEKPEGWGGVDKNAYAESYLRAIDYKTGDIRWTRKWEHEGNGLSGLLSTAGKLLFTGDPAGNFMALDPATGETLWHVNLNATVANGPMTYELDGVQYLVVGAGDSLWAFTLPHKLK